MGGDFRPQFGGSSGTAGTDRYGLHRQKKQDFKRGQASHRIEKLTTWMPFKNFASER